MRLHYGIVDKGKLNFAEPEEYYFYVDKEHTSDH